MKPLLLKNCRIIIPSGKPAFFDKGAIIIRDGRIAGIGSESEVVPDSSSEVVDMGGKFVLPGMINLHTHLYSALALGMPPPRRTPESFTEILRETWWKLDRALDEESLAASFEAGLLECLRCGVTTVFDHHSSPGHSKGSLELLVSTAKKFGVRIATAFEISDRNGEKIFREGLEENLESLSKYADDPEVLPMVGLHASFTLSGESLRAVRNALESFKNWGVHVHLAEDKVDLVDAESKGYRSPLSRLREYGLLNNRSLVAHGVHMVSEDQDILDETGVSLVHCPTSNAANRVGLLASSWIREVRTGLGTDGMSADMIREISAASLIRGSHLKGGEENVAYGDLLFRSNPRIASELFGSELGVIKEGAAADLAIFEYDPRTIVHENNIIDHIVGGLGRPSDVIVGGEFVLRDSRFSRISDKDVLLRSREAALRLWKRMVQL